MVTRRVVLLSAPATLAACGTLTQQQATQLQQLIAGAQTIEQAFITNLPLAIVAISTLNGGTLPPSTVADIRTVLAGLSQATAGLATVVSLDDPATTTKVQAFEQALNVCVAVAATLPIPPPYSGYLALAAISLPPLEALVGLAVREGTALYQTIKAGRLAVAA